VSPGLTEIAEGSRLQRKMDTALQYAPHLAFAFFVIICALSGRSQYNSYEMTVSKDNELLASRIHDTTSL
jgi:hypothetical protein